MKAAMGVGSFILMAYVQTIILMRPSLPTIIQACFFVLWLLNVIYRPVHNFIVIFIIMIAIGGLRGAAYTNFLYLANAKVNLPCDMDLIYYERELAVNMLLMASDIGKLFAFTCSFQLKLHLYPEIFFHNP